MEEHYHIAIIGSGPAGLSAAGRAAHHDSASGAANPSYVLLESFSAPAKTIQRYQKGKHVMDEPGWLNLRSDFDFVADTREGVLGKWQSGLDEQSVNIRFDTEVTAISGSKGAFEIALKTGGKITSEHVILAIGLEGNPRKLGVEGDNLEQVQYQLDDPDEYSDEVILVVGAGDSAIENALALARQNQVYIINRRDEFSRAKEGNLNAILAAASDPSSTLDAYYRSQTSKVEATPDAERPLLVTLETPEGAIEIEANRIIARLGSIPSRAFVEGAGVEFPNARPDAIPELSGQYESNVPGLYIIGSLAGYPLIKQAMNQGYDVVEYIHGNDVQPADYPLLEAQFAGLPIQQTPDELLELFQRRIPMFRQLNSLGFREMLIESNVIAAYPKGPVFEDAERRLDTAARRTTRLIEEDAWIYRAGEHATSFFTIVDGEVEIVPEDAARPTRTLGRGEFFGEASLISGRPRFESARALASCVLVETPRRTMVKLMNSNDEIRLGIDWIFVVRELQRHFAPGASFENLRSVADACEVKEFKAGETVYEQGSTGDSLHIIRRGSITLTRGAQLVTELRTGQLLGEMALMGDPQRRETAVATVASETIEVSRDAFLKLVSLDGADIPGLQARVSETMTRNAEMEVRPESTGLMGFLLGEGLGEATNALIIDESLCVGCDNCEKACAETHDGIARLDRRAGPTFGEVHIPISCRHCEHPHCMKDCPPNAIHRAPNGEVYIEDSCIGCGACEANCPYDAIHLSYDAPKKPGLFSWLFFGRGFGPGQDKNAAPDAAALERGKHAYKCDACKDLTGGPACVRACPTGAAIRVDPEQFVRLIQ